MNQVFNVTEGQPLSQSIGFVANSVTVNNLTQSWAYEPQSQTFIPPYQYGVIMNIPGTDVADLVWRTPTSLPVGPVGTGTLTAQYTDAKLTPSNGMSVFTQQTTVALQPPVAFGVPEFFTLPAGCQAVLMIGSSGGPYTASVVGITTNKYYGSAVTAQGGGLIIPVAPAVDPIVEIACSTLGVTLQVIALFTSEPEPVTAVAITGNAAVNITEIGGTPVPNDVPGVLDVNIADFGATTVTIGQKTKAASIPVTIASDQGTVANTLDVNIKDIGGSPSGALNSNIEALNGGSPIGQEAMAASFPVVVASDQSAIPENLTQIVGHPVARFSNFTGTPAGTEFQQIVGALSPLTASPNSAYEMYLGVLQRPTFDVVALNLTIAIVGSTIIAAPGAGFELVIRSITMSIASAPAAANLVTFQTSGGATPIGRFEFITGAAASPDTIAPPPLQYYDFALGDNQGLTAVVTAALGANVTVCYSIVVTNQWPVG